MVSLSNHEVVAEEPPCPNPPNSTAVLAHVDAGLDQSLERLYALLRIKSISTDPAYAAECRRAADWLVGNSPAKALTPSARPTPGHPVVVAHGPDSRGPHVLFYAHYDVQPVDPLDLWHTDPFEPHAAQAPTARPRSSWRAAPPTTRARC